MKIGSAIHMCFFLWREGLPLLFSATYIFFYTLASTTLNKLLATSHSRSSILTQEIMRSSSCRGLLATTLSLFLAGTNAQTGTLTDLGTTLSSQPNLTTFYGLIQVRISPGGSYGDAGKQLANSLLTVDVPEIPRYSSTTPILQWSDCESSNFHDSDEESRINAKSW